jgi:uncharacterized protein YecE (DUF72 family)
MYYSDYSSAFIAELAGQLRSGTANETWCVFDNTASGAAMGNALDLADHLHR